MDSILSRHDFGNSPREQAEMMIGREIEFFLWSEMYVNVCLGEVRGWFFDIYIQGSKKVQLKS